MPNERYHISVCNSVPNSSINEIFEKSDSHLKKPVCDIHNTRCVLKDSNSGQCIYFANSIKNVVLEDTCVGIIEKNTLPMRILPSAQVPPLSSFLTSPRQLLVPFLDSISLHVQFWKLVFNSRANRERIVHVGSYFNLPARTKGLHRQFAGVMFWPSNLADSVLFIIIPSLSASLGDVNCIPSSLMKTLALPPCISSVEISAFFVDRTVNSNMGSFGVGHAVRS